MGFGHWITKNLPGGYGSQARDYIEYFRKKVMSKPYNHARDWKEVFEDMVTTKGLDRAFTGNKSNSIIHIIISQKFLERTEGDLFKIVFYMVYFDNETLYKETNSQILYVTAEVIYKEVKKQFPSYVQTNIDEFKTTLPLIPF